MKLNREQIIQALEYCTGIKSVNACANCPACLGCNDCVDFLREGSLTLIKELTEENEWIKEHSLVLTISEGDIIRTSKNVSLKTLGHPDPVGKPGICGLYKQCQADTVRKMRDKFKEKLDISVYGYSTDEVVGDVFDTIDRVAEEMLEENK